MTDQEQSATSDTGTALPSVPAPRGGKSPSGWPKTVGPFVYFPDRLASTAFGRRVWTFLLFVFLPLILFAYWTFHNYTHALPETHRLLLVALPLATVVPILSPYLHSIAERAIVAWLSELGNERRLGWNVERVMVVDRRFCRLYYPLCLAGAIAGVSVLHFVEPHIRSYTPLSGPSELRLALLYMVSAFAGFSAISGLCIVLRFALGVRAAVSGNGLGWVPFVMRRWRTVRQAFRVATTLAFAFSLGGAFVPLLFVVKINANPTGQFLVWIFISLLLIGGLLAFTVPYVTIVMALARGRRRYLESVDDKISDSLEKLSPGVPEVESIDTISEQVLRMLELRRVVATAQIVPFLDALRRAILTMTVPGVSLALSIWRTWPPFTL